ncbi:MAG: hypothetical protein GX764_01160 [Firmicutes bacterium]|nr:hypothetical protein [Bacillota bacterium]
MTTYTAVRLGELDMAIANIFGANFINLALFSFADFFYRQGSLFSAVAFEHIFSTAMVIVLVCVFIFGLVYRSKRYLVRLGYDSWLILLGYIAALVMLY